MAVTIQKIDTLSGHRGPVYNLQPTQEEGIILSASGDGLVVRWDLRQPDEGVVVAKLPQPVYALHVLADSGLVLAGHNQDGVHLIDPVAGKELSSLSLTSAAIFDIASEEQRAFVASGDGIVTVVDVQRMAVVDQIAHSRASARAIALHRERREMAVGYSDCWIRVFDLDSGALKYGWEAHTSSVFTLSYSPDGSRLLSGARDARLKAWSVREEYAPSREVVAHLFALNHLTYSPNRKHFVTCSLDKTVKVWDADTMTLLKVMDKARHGGHSNSVNRLLWSSFHNRLISAGDDRMIFVWDVIF